MNKCTDILGETNGINIVDTGDINKEHECRKNTEIKAIRDLQPDTATQKSQ